MVKRKAWASATALVAGIALGGVVYLTWQPEVVEATRGDHVANLAAMHSSPGLVVPGEVVPLEVQTSCRWTNENEEGAPLDETCPLEVTLWLRHGRHGDFLPHPLQRIEGSRYHLRANLPITEASNGSAYWFEVINPRTSERLVIPERGGEAPYRFWTIDPDRSPKVTLGGGITELASPTHEVALPWGSREGHVGRTPLQPDGEGEVLGPQSLAVSGDRVLLLDSINGRVLALEKDLSSVRTVAHGLPVTSTDIGQEGDGTIHVLSSPGSGAIVNSVHPPSDVLMETEIGGPSNYLTIVPGSDREDVVRVKSIYSGTWLSYSSQTGGALAPGSVSANQQSLSVTASGSQVLTRIAKDQILAAEVMNDTVVQSWIFRDEDGKAGPIMDVQVTGSGDIIMVAFQGGTDTFEIVSVRNEKASNLWVEARNAVSTYTNRPIVIDENGDVWYLDPRDEVFVVGRLSPDGEEE